LVLFFEKFKEVRQKRAKKGPSQLCSPGEKKWRKEEGKMKWTQAPKKKKNRNKSVACFSNAYDRPIRKEGEK